MNEFAPRKVIGVYNSACLLSLTGVAAAVVAMVLSIRGEIGLALVALMLAGLADLFDGVLARRIRLSDFEKEFGIQLDTVSDAVAFVAAPVVIGVSAGGTDLLMLTGLALFVVAGVVRLAHFNTLSVRGANQSTHYRGLPVTYTALLFPVLFLLQELLSLEAFRLLLGLAFPVIGLFFVINVPIRKPRGAFYIILPLLAACLTAYWIHKALYATVGT